MISFSRRDIVVEYKDRTVIGLTEPIKLLSKKGKSKEVTARIDTGATRSSLDINMVAELQLGPVLKSKLVKSASGNTVRPIIKTDMLISNKRVTAEFTLADREHMKYKALIGQDVLKSNRFLIDPTKR
ncbi:MAG: RimK/LysX family protein [Candidatus Woesearchaeota archaeon]